MSTASDRADPSPEPALRGDMSRREQVDTTRMEWSPSPSPTVVRKRLHRVGPAEAGQVTSVVRYAPGARFPEHDHPEGEEILVLEGVFSDQRGDHAAGSYLLSPEGHRHAPWSEPGCVLLVKLRQYGGEGRRYVEIQTRGAAWQATPHEGVEEQVLYADPAFDDATRLERWRPGAAPGARELPGGAELFVLEGAIEDAEGRHGEGTWLRLPPGAALDARAPDGAQLYLKSGGVAGLRSG